jgi:hypothetical protein
MRARLFLALLVVAVFIGACGGDNVITPVTPQGSPTLISVTVTGTLAVLNGQTTQLTATANFAKGTTQDVTGAAAWSSVNPTIATVSSTGLVTALAAGVAEIRATYQNVTGGMQLTVNRPPTYSVIGGVTETVPHTSTNLSGVRVEIIDGANQGKFSLTNGSGQYQITDVLAGTFNVRASLTNYDSSTKSLTINTNATLSFALNPTSRQINETFTATISGGDPAGNCGSPCKTFAIPIHNTGTVQATLAWTSVDDARLLLQLYNADTNRVVAQSPITPSDTSTSTRETVSAVITAPGNYELRVIAWQIARITSFSVTTSHVN